MVSIGFECAKGRSNCKSLLYVNPNNDAKLYLHSGVIIAKGTRIIVDNGIMEIGNNFFCNGDCSFYCNTSISIGNNNMYGWNVHFNTTSGHPFFVNGEQVLMSDEIRIGNHVWIGSYSIITKGTHLASESVVAQSSLVNASYDEVNCLIGGIPARLIKNNISWSAK
jgi:acetyltransferase-like isoleucine patch superfamily enzyme